MKIKNLLWIASLVMATACSNDPVTKGTGKIDSQKAPPVVSQSQPIESEKMANDIGAPAPNQELSAGMSVRKSKERRLIYPQAIVQSPQNIDRENYAHFKDQGIKLVKQQPVSTFSIDVDTGSYSNMRRMLRQGRLPVKDAIRVEELINYFDYDYALPEKKGRPFNVHTELAPSPWNKHNVLLHIGIKAYDMPRKQRPASNLVFLLDVSGSMRSANKLGLLKSSLKLLVGQLNEKDRVSMVVYAGASGVVLEPTAGNQHGKIISALERLQAGGSTNGGAGIRLAYHLARQAYIKEGINRILLATDGDFNVGTVNFQALKNLIEEERKSGIGLTSLGFGTGNYNDHLMEQLADAGNGNYSYIDTLNEAQKVLVDEMSSTLMTVAKDVKIQIEFNPQVVAEYRLIGYENRALKREDFNNDKVDAGDIGAGHTVTALYELTLNSAKHRALEPLRYQEESNNKVSASNELAFLKLRYKRPNGHKSKLIKQAILKDKIKASIAGASQGLKFATAVAAFGQLLRGGTYLDSFSYDEILTLARQGKGQDPHGYRGEFYTLVKLAKSLARSQAMN